MLSVDYKLELTDVEDNMRVVDDVTSPLYVTLSGQGAALWRENRKNRVINVSARHFTLLPSGVSVMRSSLLRDSLSAFLPATLSIREMHPDTIRFSSIEVVSRRLPVKFDGELTDDGRYSAENIIIDPEYINVSIPKSQVYSVPYIPTEYAHIDIKSDSSYATLRLALPDGVESDVEEVRVSIVSSQYTEKSVTIPVAGLNVPSGMIFRAFPSRVKVMFLVSLNDFESIGADDFTVAVDLNDVNSGSDKVEPVLINSPVGVRNVRIQPGVLNYMLEKDSSAQ